MYFSIKQVRNKYQLAGFSYFMDKYSVDAPYCRRIMCISRAQKNSMDKVRNIELVILNNRYRLKQEDVPNLVFVLKHETVDLIFLRNILKRINKKDLKNYIENNMSGKYAKKIYFLYEYLLNKELEIKDEMKGAYIDILEDDRYFTAKRIKFKKYKINDNFLGNRNFNPIVRKTQYIVKMISKDFSEKINKILSDTGEDILSRAVDFLYKKETKSSYKIENETAPKNKIEIFIELLKYAKDMEYLDKDNLTAIQNEIVLSKDKEDKDYYTKRQNYVGSYRNRKPIIHFIAARPKDKHNLMKGLLGSNKRMKESGTNPFIRAAVISYGFVFIHPFSDGNGRLHRFIIHSILKSSGIVPKEIIIPISANMLNNPHRYNESLGNFSKPLMRKISYKLDENEEITVKGETK
ncbi:MAG: Fic family protein, partial [Atribacterota bacterium]